MPIGLATREKKTRQSILQEALQIAREAGLKKNQGIIHMSMARPYVIKVDYNKALDCYLKATDLLTQVYQDLCDIYKEQYNVPMLQAAADSALATTLNMSNNTATENLCSIYTDEAVAHFYKQEWNIAVDYVQKALATAQQQYNNHLE